MRMIRVVKVTQGSIHVIVLGFSSAVITDEDIRDEFVYKTVSAYLFTVMFQYSYLSSAPILICLHAYS